jgi:hypothetical protein
MRKSGEFRTASTPGDERRTTATAVETEWLAARGRLPEKLRGSETEMETEKVKPKRCQEPCHGFFAIKIPT